MRKGLCIYVSKFTLEILTIGVFLLDKNYQKTVSYRHFIHRISVDIGAAHGGHKSFYFSKEKEQPCDCSTENSNLSLAFSQAVSKKTLIIIIWSKLKSNFLYNFV